tara:strand:+ start:89 stop:322 length:234 start_codon:yes stop_codon:yes gene_type:complete
MAKSKEINKDLTQQPNISLDDPDLEDFAKYLYGYVSDYRLDFTVSKSRYATRILIESIILIAAELKGIKKALEKNNG